MDCIELTGSPSEKIAALGRIAERWTSDPAVRRLAQETAYQAPEVVLGLVQRLPYHNDRQREDTVCSPGDVLAKGGDCEDRAALFAALMRVRGATVRLVWLGDERAPEDHVTVELWDGSAWLWADPTVPGARIGEEPHAAAARTGYGARVGARDAGSMGTMYGAPPR